MQRDEDICVDWRGRACNSNKHGGMGAAAFVLGKLPYAIYMSGFLMINNKHSRI